MELQTYLAILWRRKWIILATTLITFAVAALITYLATPIYVSSTTLRVATVGANPLGGGRTEIDYTVRLMNTYANIIKSRTSGAELVSRLGLEEWPVLSVTLIPGTELMRIEAEATDPEVARAIAAAAAEIVIRQSQEQYRGGGASTQEIIARQIAQVEQELEQARADYDQLLGQSPQDSGELSATAQSIQLKERTYATLLEQYENARIQEALRGNSVYIIEAADAPIRPAKPRVLVNLVLALMVGGLLGVGLAFLVDFSDSTLHTPNQIEATTRLPTIGRIPVINGHAAVLDFNAAPNGNLPYLEAFRRLRVNLLSPREDEPSQAILITSAETGEGKSTVTVNLAMAMAKAGRRVVALDCDLHQPSLHTLFRVSNEFGLTSVLTGQVSLSGVVQKGPLPNLHVITSGPALMNPSRSGEFLRLAPSSLVGRLEQGTELLGTREMAKLLDQLKGQYDVVLLDTPALLAVTDAAVLAPLVDSVLLVVATERSQRDSIRTVIELLDSVKVKSIGVVINREHSKVRQYGYQVKG
jgi:Mrp family chromosome partitioning ATPase